MKPILTKVCLSLGWIGICWGEPTAATPNYREWESVQSFNVETPGLMKVELPWEAFQNKKEDRSDFRLVSPSGEEIGYFVETPKNPRPQKITPRSVRSMVESKSTTHFIALDGATPVNSIQFETSLESYSKALSIEGIKGNGEKVAIQVRAPFFCERGSGNMQRIPIPSEPWVSIKLIIHEEKLDEDPVRRLMIKNVIVQTVPMTSALDSVKKLPVREQVNGLNQSRLSVNLPSPGILIHSISLETSELYYDREIEIFQRKMEKMELIEKTLSSGRILKFQGEGKAADRTGEFLVGRSVQQKELLLKIENGLNPPLHVTSVILHYTPCSLVFQAPVAGKYSLYSGNAKAVQANYDLGTFSNQISKLVQRPVQWMAVGVNPNYAAKNPYALLEPQGAALDVTPWKFRVPVQNQVSGIQRLDLSMHAITHAKSDFSDLRLMIDGKQWPYILQKGTFTQTFEPEIEKIVDSLKPSVSRLKVKFPYEKIPMTGLYCSSAQPLFRRDIVVYEEVLGNQGKKREILGSAKWEAIANNEGGQYKVELRAPKGNVIYFEYDNGDNAAVDFSDFKISYPVSSLYFKSLQPRSFQLCYGNTDAQMPQYDLSMIASQILEEHAEKVVCTDPSGVERNQGITNFMQSRGWKYLFWGVLTLVVFGLLFVVGKLMPVKAE